jgi:hypothetical protein
LKIKSNTNHGGIEVSIPNLMSMNLSLSQYKWGVMDEWMILRGQIFAGVADGLILLQI